MTKPIHIGELIRCGGLVLLLLLSFILGNDEHCKAVAVHSSAGLQLGGAAETAAETLGPAQLHPNLLRHRTAAAWIAFTSALQPRCNMAERVAPNDRTPLLGDTGSAPTAGDEESFGTRAKRWIYKNLITISLIIPIIVLLAVVISLAVKQRHSGSDSPPSHRPGHNHSSGASTCTSPQCVLAAATLLKSISKRYKDLDACEDFRTFSCEGFDAIHEIPSDQSNVGSLKLMADDGQLILKHILESPAPTKESLFWTASNPDKAIFTKLQDAYGACMNETLLESLGSLPLLELLAPLEELYPKKQPKGKKKLDTSLTDALQYLESIGVGGPLALGIGADDKDPGTNVLQVGAPYSFGLPSKEYYNNTEIVTLYKDTIGSVLEALLKEAKPDSFFVTTFANLGSPHVLNSTVVDSVVAFEQSAANSAPDPEDANDVTKYYNPRTPGETALLIPDIQVLDIVKNFTGGFIPPKVIVTSPDYLKSLSKLLHTQDRETLQAYLAWKVVASWGGSVESDAVKPLLRFRNKLQGKAPDVKSERWKTCISVVDSDLSWILSRSFIEAAFSKEAKDLGDQIIHDIKDEFSRKLNASEWMTESVRKLAIDKVHYIRQKIGYPTKSPDITKASVLEKYYANVKISKDTFFRNRISATQADIAREWDQANHPVDKDTWGMTASTVNAYYNPPGNEIVFPAGIMQSPVFYSPSVPKYLSYGAFGAVAGHELSHAFDSSGRNYDQNGNYTDWWDNSTIVAFKKKTDCFVEQYHNYTVPTKDGPLPINGKLTLGENIADAGGLTAAFQSWKRRDAENPDQLLPGLEDFTKEQVFFLAYGLTWCGKHREEEIVQRIYTDPHSPDSFRIKVRL
jgi:endothelin-converting enzyme